MMIGTFCALMLVALFDDTRRGGVSPLPMAMMQEAAHADAPTPAGAGEIEIRAQATLMVSIR